MKAKLILAAAGVVGLVLLSACKTYPDYTSDFRFPILQGDIGRGQQAFTSLGCTNCHAVSGVQLPRSAASPVTVMLGGELMFAKTYGDLVTSIINPDHVISDRYLTQLPRGARQRVDSSPMYMNPEMKVSELIDIVAFLNSRYSLLPGYTEYYY